MGSNDDIGKLPPPCRCAHLSIAKCQTLVRKETRMRYCCIVIAIMLAFSLYGYCDETYTIQFQINKPYCLLNFMETLRTNGFYGPTLYEYYKKSRFNDDENLKSIVTQYNKLNIKYSYEFGGYPKYRYMSKGRSTRDLFYILSAKSESLSEFRQITVGVIPYYQHQELFKAFEAVEPIYDELVWNQYSHAAEQKLLELEEYARQINLSEKLRTVADFFNSSWPGEVPIIASFAIVPGEKVKLIPPPQGNVIFGGLLTELADNSGNIGRIVHEFAHRSFAEQSLPRHQQINQWFLDSESPSKHIVNFMFNEALGGAIGHRINEELTGPHEFTYGQSFMRDFDEAIYPLVVSYLDEGKSIDSSFIDQSLKIFEETFPNVFYEYHYLFQTYYLLTDVEDYHGLPKLIMKNISSPLMYELGAPIVNDENMDKLIAYDFTKLLIITRDNESTLNYLNNKIAGLERFKDLDPKSDFILSFHGADGKAYIVVNLHSIERFETVLERLKAQKAIAPDGPVMLLD